MNSLYIAQNLFKRAFCDLKGWLSFLIIPTVIVSIIVSFIGTESSKKVDIGYVNLDEGVFGEQLILELSQKNNYHLIELSERDLKDRIIQGKLPIGFIIPSGFTSQLLANQEVQTETYRLNINETAFSFEQLLNQTVGQIVRTVKTVKASQMSTEDIVPVVERVFAQKAKNQVKSKVTDYQLYVNENLYLVIGFILYFLMGLVLNSLGIVLEDRTQLTMTRIYTAPVRSIEIAAGNFLGSFGLGALQIFVVLVITHFILGYNYGISFLSLYIILCFFLLAAVGIGSALAGLIKNSQNLGSLNALVITPTSMIGGSWWPLAIMPEFMQKLANFTPQKWAIEAVNNLASGQSFTQVSIHLGILTLFAVIFLGFGAVILSPSEKGA